MFDSDNINTVSTRRRYKNDFFLLAACLLIALVFFLFSGSGDSGGAIEVNVRCSGQSRDTYSVVYPLNKNGYIAVVTFNGSLAVVSDGGETLTGITPEILSGLEEARSFSDGFDRLIDGKTDVNILEVTDGHVRMIEATCPDGLCVRSGAISVTGQTVCCLPHGVIVTVRAGSDGEASFSGNGNSLDGEQPDAVTW